MVAPKRLELLGSPGSPYSRKMISALRYRHIPFSVFWGDAQVPDGYPSPKVKLLPTFYFPDGPAGEVVPVTDSTPIIRRLEEEYLGRSLIPDDPALSFLNDLIEDFADEWLTKAMFHFRWSHEADWKNAQSLLIYWGMNTAPKDMADEIGSKFARRQIDRLYVVGSNEVTARTIDESYARLVKILDELIETNGFVLGARPSSADFALFGQLSQLAVIEPTSAKITQSVSQRVRAWVDLMEDLSGLRPSSNGWMDVESSKALLSPLLEEIGRTYAPTMVANTNAIMSGADTFETEIDGKRWAQPVFKYQAKCLGWLREKHRALSIEARTTVDALLADTGCEILFG